MSAAFDMDVALSRIAQLRAEIADRSAEICRLQDIIDGPRVTVLAHYARYHHDYTEECETIGGARTFLDLGLDNGWLAPEGISVNGEFKDEDDWPTNDE